MNVVASATVGGRRTNRVRVRRKAKSAGTARVAFRKDPSTRGLDYAVICASLPIAELEAIDAACQRVQMARSHFLRQAAKHFIEQIGAKP